MGLRRRSATFGGDIVFRIGAPRSMNMGTTRPLFLYDAAARHALQSVVLRRPAILRYALWAAVFPIAG
jgi:hypothetical protein